MPPSTPERRREEPSGTDHSMHARAQQAARAEDVNPEILKLLKPPRMTTLARALKSVGPISTGEDRDPAELADTLGQLTITGPELRPVSTAAAEDEPPIEDGDGLWDNLLEESGGPTTWEQDQENEN